MRARYLILVFGLIALPRIAWGQSMDDPMQAGILAFREARYEEAERGFQRAIRAEPDNAEAHFLLARLYTETSLEDFKKAENALDRAIELDPDNVIYLVGRLRLLRKDSRIKLVNRVREGKRIYLARKILAIDSTNAFAHEEMGDVWIQDFWRYRNAIMLPSMNFSGNLYRGSGAMALGDPTLASMPSQLDQEVDEFGNDIIPTGPEQLPPLFSLDPADVFLADRFDVENLEEMGVPIVDLASRAQRAYDRAIGHLDAALESDPRRRSVYRRLMEIYALKGEYEVALAMLRDMHAFFGEDPDDLAIHGVDANASRPCRSGVGCIRNGIPVHERRGARGIRIAR